MTNQKPKWEEMFDEKFPCIETECDNNGTIIGRDRYGDFEQQQCQYCYENRLPYKQFISKTIQAEREESNKELEDIKEQVEHCENCKADLK